MRRLASFLTSALILCAAAFAVWQGAAMARFAMLPAAETELAAGRPQAADQSSADAVLPRALRAAALAADYADWRDAPGLRDAAREAYLAALIASGRAAPADVEQAAADVLAAAPAASRHWVLLAEARLRRGAPLEEAVEALRMARVTGPREAASMWLRARLALAAWELLPAEERAAAAADLAAIRPALDGGRIEEAKALAAAKPAAVRREIGRALAARPGAAPLVAALGLQGAAIAP